MVSLATTGLTNREVAAQLGVAKRTVDNLLHRAYGKSGVRNRDEAADVLDHAPTR